MLENFMFAVLVFYSVAVSWQIIRFIIKTDKSFINKIYIKSERPHPTDCCYTEFGWDVIERMDKSFINHKGDNSRNAEFNKKVLTLLGPKAKILDIGCGCGEAIADLIDEGYTAIGIDGLSLWEKHKCVGWGKYPENFFQADVGHFFYIKHYQEDWLKEKDESVIFDLIMSWECFEHVKTDDIDKLMINIDRHSKPGTIFVGSASIIEEGYVHRTLHKRGWWLKKFHTIGFEEVKGLNEFFGKDIIRDLGGLSEYFFLRKI